MSHRLWSPATSISSTTLSQSASSRTTPGMSAPRHPYKGGGGVGYWMLLGDYVFIECYDNDKQNTFTEQLTDNITMQS